MATGEEEKKSRSAFKGLVTKVLRAVERRTAEDDRDLLPSVLKEARNAFEKFEASHEAFIATQSGTSDEEDAYFLAVHKYYVCTVRAARALLGAAPSSAKNSSADVVEILSFPKVQLSVYYGDPMDYHSWKQVFDEMVHKANISDSVKLTRMLQYTKGAAHLAIKRCVLLKDGYNEARKILEKRFGSAHLITASLLTSLKEGPPVKSPEQLRALSDELYLCLSSLECSSTLSSVDAQSLIVQLLHRLPGYLQTRWRREAVDTRRERGTYPVFKEFCAFMEQEADHASDPIYGRTPCKNDSQRTAANFATQTSSRNSHGTSNCMYCDGKHKLLFCFAFFALPLLGRLHQKD